MKNSPVIIYKEYISSVFLIVLLMHGHLSRAQVTVNRECNLFRAGDVTLKKQIKYENLGRNGKSVLWDLGNIEVLNDKYRVSFKEQEAFPSRMTEIQHGTRYYYDVRNDSVLQIGFENNTTLMNYDYPEITVKYPMQYGDSISGIFHGRGLYCDKAAIRMFGTYKTSTDAFGTLILPDGDTLRNVLRVHTERIMSNLYYPVDSLENITFGRCFSADSINKYLDCGLNVYKTDIYRWYAPACRYPVVETVKTVGEGMGNPVIVTAFYYSPSDQEFLTFDENNNKVKQKMLYCGNGDCYGDKTRPNNLDYNIFINRDETEIRLEYISQKESKVLLSLYTISGMCIFNKEVMGNSYDGISIEKINIGSLKPGVVILDICVDNRHYCEKIIKH